MNINFPDFWVIPRIVALVSVFKGFNFDPHLETIRCIYWWTSFFRPWFDIAYRVQFVFIENVFSCDPKPCSFGNAQKYFN